MNRIKPTIVALAAFATVSAQAQPGPPLEQMQQMLRPYASDADVVTLADGRKVAFTCMGQGSPTVILIPGMGDFAGLSWGPVQPRMAATTRVCAWDRPGWGLSDGWEGTHTVATSTAALEAALATGRIPGPYVFVGHSLGGYESLLYADRHRDQVVGMVLVDSSIPDQNARMRAAGLPTPDLENGPVAAFRTCAAAVREGRSKFGGPDPDNCVTYPPFFPPELVRALGEKVGNPVQYETMASFMVSMPEDSALVEEKCARMLAQYGSSGGWPGRACTAGVSSSRARKNSKAARSSIPRSSKFISPSLPGAVAGTAPSQVL